MNTLGANKFIVGHAVGVHILMLILMSHYIYAYLYIKKIIWSKNLYNLKKKHVIGIDFIANRFCLTTHLGNNRQFVGLYITIVVIIALMSS